MHVATWGRMRLAALAAVAVLGTATFAACDDAEGDNGGGSGSDESAMATVGDLAIYDAYVRYTFSANAGTYFRVENRGDSADRLLSVSSSASDRAEIHEVVTEGTGGTMQQLEEGLEIPANGEVTLEVGSYHVMLMELPGELEHGDEVELELTFEEAGSVTLTVPVEVIGEEDDDEDH